MCLGAKTPKVEKKELPQVPAPAPPPEAPPAAPVYNTESTANATKKVTAAREGTRSLRIDLNVGSSPSRGLNIPQA